MKILACLKQVPDTTEVKMSDSFTLERDFVAQVMNPADESALEIGMKLRDACGGTVTVLTMGPERASSMLRESLARGADDAVHMTDPAFAGADTLVTAKCLKACITSLGGYDLILCGRRASDGETGQVGPMLASLLDIPCVVNATDAVWENGGFTVKQLTEDGTAIWKSEAPALITLCEWSHRLRLPTIMGLKRAANAPIRRITAAELQLNREETGLRASPTRVVKVSARPIGVRPCRKMDAEEAFRVLAEEGVMPL